MRSSPLGLTATAGVVVALLLSGCGSRAPDANAINTAIAQTQAAQATDTPPPPTETPTPTRTPVPPTATATVPVEELWARNYLGVFDSNGVTVEIVRVLVGTKASMADIDWAALDETIAGWSGTNVVGEIVFRVTNGTDQPVRVALRQGAVQIGGQSIALAGFFGTGFGEDLSLAVPPGDVRVGGQWFAIQGLTPDQVTQITYRAGAPVDAQTSQPVGPAIEIVMDVTLHVWEDFPPEIVEGLN